MSLRLGDTKTDNRENGFGVKLELRRMYLREINVRPIRVLDACSGSGQIWKKLSTEFRVELLRIDKKGGRGCLKMDSIRFLESQDLTGFHVVDIDTYGEPWNHFLALKNNSKRNSLTVFLTYGFISQGIGVIGNTAKKAMGIPLSWNLSSLYGKDLRDYQIHVIIQSVINSKQAIISDKVIYMAFNLPK